jgi:hypothetical protein
MKYKILVGIPQRPIIGIQKAKKPENLQKLQNGQRQATFC